MESASVPAGPLDDIDWKSYEVDDETLEDIEISLYGMLHHTDEGSFPSHNQSPVNLNQSSDSPGALKEVGDVGDFVVPAATSTTSTISGYGNLRHSSSPERKKVEVSRTNSNGPPTRKCNPFGEYIVIEHCTGTNSSNSCPTTSKKSEVIELSDDDEDSKYRSITKNVNKRVLPKKSARVVCEVEDSSDSDGSVMLVNKPYFSDSDSESELEVIESTVNDDSFKLNISGCIEPESRSKFPDSDGNHPTVSSVWQNYSCEKWTQEMIEFYDKDGENRDLEKIAASLPRNVNWFVDRSDRFGDLPSLRKNRYFAGKTRIRCLNCNHWDHVARNCREPKKIACCNVCGDPGHSPFQCPKKVCFGCGRPSKIYIECCPDCRRERGAVCLICKLNHLTTQCPDLWRRYHMTTTLQSQPTATTTSLKPDHLQKCYLCAGSGHLPFNCRAAPQSKYLMPNPAVIQYEDSRQFLDELTNGGQNSVVMSNPKSLWVVRGSNDSPAASSSYIRSPKLLKYSISDAGLNSRALDTARFNVMKSVSNVQIDWRRQPKKGRFFVEFSGHGDTLAARSQFKKLLTFKKEKSGKKPLLPTSIAPTKETMLPPVTLPPTTRNALPQNALPQTALSKNMQRITVIHRNVHNKQLRCSRQLNLSPRDHKQLCKLLVKLESRYRVAITSSKLPHEWEIFVNSRTDDFSSVSASSSCIINHLNRCS